MSTGAQNIKEALKALYLVMSKYMETLMNNAQFATATA
jgi:hypothetical protein